MLSKYLKNIGLKRHQITGLPGAPTRLGQDLIAQSCAPKLIQICVVWDEIILILKTFSQLHTL
jgi:hypothetical protein